MNDHSKDSQTRYLREAAIVLAKEGFQSDEIHADRLCILLDGSPLCEVTESGGITYRNEMFTSRSESPSRTRCMRSSEPQRNIYARWRQRPL